MIFNKTNGKITAGGWNINSDLLQNDFPLAANSQVGGGSRCCSEFSSSCWINYSSEYD